MEGLFSVFDPSDFLGFSMNWASCLVFLVFAPGSFWVVSSPLMQAITSLLGLLFNEFKHLMGKTYYVGSVYTFMVILSFILINNLMGLFPYIFTSPSHLSFSLALAVPLWLGLFSTMYSLMTKTSFAMLVPKGSPTLLSPMMVLVEILSNSIRPLTLAVRLSANIMAGHLLIVLVSLPCSSSTAALLVLTVAGLSLLMTLEMAVACIQSYVFSVLSCLYYSETGGELSKSMNM